MVDWLKEQKSLCDAQCKKMLPMKIPMIYYAEEWTRWKLKRKCVRKNVENLNSNFHLISKRLQSMKFIKIHACGNSKFNNHREEIFIIFIIFCICIVNVKTVVSFAETFESRCMYLWCMFIMYTCDVEKFLRKRI